ncbi:MAG: Lrp/AsnC family transcriptional regulator [Dehalococcoidales bacterium]
MHLDVIEQKLLDLLQTKFPLMRRPYADLGLSLGIAEEEIMQRIRQLKAKDLIRQISPVFDAASLGYKTTLVAMRVVGTQLDKAAKLISQNPGVSHAYERDHHFNLWFTLAVPATVEIEAELQRLTSAVSAETVFSLPALKLFKLRTYFGSDGDDQPEADSEIPGDITSQEVQLSPVDRRVINELQQDLPLISRPFAEMAARSGMDEEKFLALSQSLLPRGIMRRFGASINHRRVGFAANAMTCWAVPAKKVEVIAKKLASLREVSHCYQRKTNPLWRYNLFAMIHGHTKEECQEIADKVSTKTGFTDYVLLFSTKEFKKTRVKYLV